VHSTSALRALAALALSCRDPVVEIRSTATTWEIGTHPCRPCPRWIDGEVQQRSGELVNILSEPGRRRRCTAVVVGPPCTVPITPEDDKLAVDTIARMIAQWWDANGRQIPDTEQHNGTDDATEY
jgi:hypothetical protein